MLKALFNAILGKRAPDPLEEALLHFKNLLQKKCGPASGTIPDAACSKIVKLQYLGASHLAPAAGIPVMGMFADGLETATDEIAVLFVEPTGRFAEKVRESYVGRILREHGVEAAKL